MAKPEIIDVSQQDAVVVENIDYFVTKDCFKNKTIIDYTFNNCTFKGVNFAGACGVILITQSSAIQTLQLQLLKVAYVGIQQI
jgi:hypothetical protein